MYLGYDGSNIIKIISMAEIVRNTHYHEDSDAPARGNGVLTAIVVVVFILLALFFFSRGFSGNNTDTTGGSTTPNVELEGSASGSASGTTGQ